MRVPRSDVGTVKKLPPTSGIRAQHIESPEVSNALVETLSFGNWTSSAALLPSGATAKMALLDDLACPGVHWRDALGEYDFSGDQVGLIEMLSS